MLNYMDYEFFFYKNNDYFLRIDRFMFFVFFVGDIILVC